MSLVLADNLLSQIDDLDHILECPVCYERMTEKISLCTQGHPMCKKCSVKILKCPLCNSNLNGARDFLAESIISKLEEIKSAITNLALESSVHYTEKIKPEAPVVKVAKFPCAIKYCQNVPVMSYGDMIDHIKAHENILINEGIIHSETYTNWWTIHFFCATDWARIIYIKNMGIFFVKISISRRGNVYGYVTNVNGLDNRKYFYELKIYNPNNDSLFFDGQVASTTDPLKKTQYLSVENALYKNNFGNSCFTCGLRIILI